VGPLSDVIGFVRRQAAEWQAIRVSELQFFHDDSARLALLALVAIAAALLVAKALWPKTAGRRAVALPAVLRGMPSQRFAMVQTLPVLAVAVGVCCFAVALADPYTAVARQEVTHPGRRIAIMLDASSSMSAPFTSETLYANAPGRAAFYTTVGAAERFIQMRRRGKYRDLFALIEFGSEAYVVTPFTTDYDNILLSIALISEQGEWSKFPDYGTTVVRAIEEGVALFRAFDFLEASGNLLVLFSDGQDTQTMVHGRTVDEILADAVRWKVPVYFIRTSFEKGIGSVVPDAMWKAAIEKTGGRFYAAADEASILRAIQDIDRLSAGTIAIKQYSTERRRYAPFALAAVACWALALAMKLTAPVFTRFP
jgi:Ca-activated chloride channel family protein